MSEIWDRVVKATAALGGAIAGLFGGWSPLLTALAVFMALDYLTGIAVAARGKSTKTESGGLSSKAGFRGLLRKAMIVLVVLMSTILDRAIGGGAAVFQGASVCFYIANEGLSVLENTEVLGLPIPPFLRRALENVHKKGENPDE